MIIELRLTPEQRTKAEYAQLRNRQTCFKELWELYDHRTRTREELHG